MNKKYELTNETIEVNGHILHRIKALIDINVDIPEYDVKAGDLGGFIEKEENLSHDGRCWVGNNAWVYGNARVFDDAQVFDDAVVSHNAKVHDRAIVGDYATVRGDAEIYDDAFIYDNADVFGTVYGDAMVHGDASVGHGATVYGDAEICGTSSIIGNAQVCGDPYIFCSTISTDAFITSNDDYLTVSIIGSKDSKYDSPTFFKCKDGCHIYVECGSFGGIIDEFEDYVDETYKDTKFAKECKLAIQMAKLHINITDKK